jgi:hypothetical protein
LFFGKAAISIVYALCINRLVPKEVGHWPFEKKRASAFWIDYLTDSRGAKGQEGFLEPGQRAMIGAEISKE